MHSLYLGVRLHTLISAKSQLHATKSPNYRDNSRRAILELNCTSSCNIDTNLLYLDWGKMNLKFWTPFGHNDSMLARYVKSHDTLMITVMKSAWGWGHLDNFLCPVTFPIFQHFSNYMLVTQHHTHIWQVLLQLSCSDTCQIWMWFR